VPSHLPRPWSHPCPALATPAAASGFKQLAMLVVARHMQPEEVEGLRLLFQQLDEEATGTISMAQLQEAMRHMGKEVGGAQSGRLGSSGLGCWARQAAAAAAAPDANARKGISVQACLQLS
jgi:hypothetical protein